LVDANIIGIFFWDFEGRILEANDAFLRMVGRDRDELVLRRVRSMDLTTTDRVARDERQSVPELRMSGSLQPFETDLPLPAGIRDRDCVPQLADINPDIGFLGVRHDQSSDYED
jgi:PAS domain-containing protein